MNEKEISKEILQVDDNYINYNKVKKIKPKLELNPDHFSLKTGMI